MKDLRKMNKETERKNSDQRMRCGGTRGGALGAAEGVVKYGREERNEISLKN